MGGGSRLNCPFCTAKLSSKYKLEQHLAKQHKGSSLNEY